MRLTKREVKEKKRHSYKSKGTRTKVMEDIPTEDLIQEEEIDDHFVSSESNFIPNELSDYYFLCFMVKYLMIGQNHFKVAMC